MTDQPTRILIVEDNFAQAETIQEMLESINTAVYIVTKINRLNKALVLLAESQFDVVLLDLNLPDSAGLDGVRRLLNDFSNLPVIMLTNVEDESIVNEAAHIGAHDYLFKRELSPSVLQRSVRYAVERQRSAQALLESEERYALAVAGANEGIWDWKVGDENCYFSPRWCDIVGYSSHCPPSRIVHWFDRVHPEDLSGLKFSLQAHLESKTEHFAHEHRLMGPGHRYIWVQCRALAVRDAGGNAYRIAGSLSDCTERKRTENQLLHDALHDTLTKLPNRSLFLDRVRVLLKRFNRDNADVFAVLFFDLDRFKYVNDSLGHSVGDELLQDVAKRLNQILRPGDTLARLGGDEFGILLPDAQDREDVVRVVERVHEHLSRPFFLRESEVFVSASIGVVFAAPDYESPEEMLRDSDLAMYRAKLDGRGKFQIFDNRLRDSVVVLHRLETDLRKAIENEEFVVHYQPIVSIASGQVQGFEALLRWQHPHWGMVQPDYFLNVAEETGLIVPIGWWVLEEAAQQILKWQELFPQSTPLSLSVNVSGRLFLQRDVLERLTAILERTGLAPETLHLEITESALIDHGKEVLSLLDSIRELGVQLQVDDFGTGYASLTYLQRFSYDSLKIDRSFVLNMIDHEDSNAIVRAIVALGESLGMKVIAEGVETPEQLSCLQQLNCEQAQGYWFSKPMDVVGIENYLTQRQ